MSREAQNTLLLLLGGAVLVTVHTGEHLKYVRPSLTPFLVVSGVLIVLLAVATMIRDYRAGDSVAHDAVDDDGDVAGPARSHEPGGGHHHHGAGPAWALALPILVLLAVAPPAIGANAVDSNSARAGNAPSRAAVIADLPPGEKPEVSLLRVIQVAQPESGVDVEDRVVTVTGFLAPAVSGTGLDLARISILCCAADARTLRMHLVGAAPALAEGTWVQVEGTIAPGSASAESQWVPDFAVSRMQAVEAPQFQYTTY